MLDFETKSFRLYNDVKIPAIGFGTWQAPSAEETIIAVKSAVEAGYRHIDGAAAYHNETYVGEGILGSGVKRDELFITSKLHNTKHGYKETHEAFEQTRKDLGLDYLDLYLIHWPNPISSRDCWKAKNAETWKAFEELLAAGKVRAIGISNFMPHHIDALLETAKVKPMVNQIRLCPGESQPEVVSYCKKLDILLEAYSPFGTGKIFAVPQMQEIAAKYGKSVAQVCVRYSLQNDWLPLPKSVTPSRIAENIDVFGFTLSGDDMAVIAGLTGCCGPTKDPDTIEF